MHLRPPYTPLLLAPLVDRGSLPHGCHELKSQSWIFIGLAFQLEGTGLPDRPGSSGRTGQRIATRPRPPVLLGACAPQTPCTAWGPSGRRGCKKMQPEGCNVVDKENPLLGQY